ncbi:iron complex transport system ATP-binding protein [Dethiosulfatibacter aminovorans DSM 17477]|uniref:Iron complex transport system ATP-binding protein n=1 Tax=Dethiosulfatibacter aminovorans DSM 17477 TaxID=1121476 RepID=A0A1M6AEY1_9FIRM|nr:ABC transporter ATP-binding protein [Dethiosulfatibacter aminovorans]SHI34967.1 iron complex transport system ATP-binding protein [Dethiosulfatibacter aminovorans DSM 17477]
MLIIDNISFSYEDKEVLENISFAVKKGQLLSIIGPNGCGKTTLINCILGVNRITRGSMTHRGRELDKMSARERAKLFSYVPQEKGHIFPYTVLEIVLMGRTPYHSIFSSPNGRDTDIAMEALEMVGMEGFRDKLFTKLSGGERQLVVLARSLAQESDIILMDEPTASLDYKNEIMFLEMVKSLCLNKNKTIIMSTHFPNHSFYFENHNLDTRVIMLADRKIKYQGLPSVVLTEDNVYNIYGVKSRILTYDGNKKHIVPIGGTENEKE